MLKCIYIHRHVYLWIYKNIYFLSKVKVCVKTFRILKKVGPPIPPLEKSNKFPKYPLKNPTLFKTTIPFEFSLIQL